MKILILTSTSTSYSIKRLIEEGEKRNHEMITENPVDLMTYISSTTRGYDMTYRKSTPDNGVKRVLSKSYDVIIPRFGGANIFEFGASLTEHLSGNMRIPSTSWSIGLRTASNKLMSAQAFSQNNVRTTKSVFAYKPRGNYSISRSGEKVELTDEQQQLAINAARAVCLEGVCAIDMMVCSKTDSTYVIEANGNGSLNGIEKITGENVAGAIIDYAEKIGR